MWYKSLTQSINQQITNVKWNPPPRLFPSHLRDDVIPHYSEEDIWKLYLPSSITNDCTWTTGMHHVYHSLKCLFSYPLGLSSLSPRHLASLHFNRSTAQESRLRFDSAPRTSLLPHPYVHIQFLQGLKQILECSAREGIWDLRRTRVSPSPLSYPESPNEYILSSAIWTSQPLPLLPLHWLAYTK